MEKLTQKKRNQTLVDVLMMGGAKTTIGLSEPKNVVEKMIRHAFEDPPEIALVFENCSQSDYVDPATATTVIFVMEKILMISVTTYIESNIIPVRPIRSIQ